MQLSICYFLPQIPFHLFHWCSKTNNSSAGMEKVLSPSQCRFCPYLVVLVTEVTDFSKKIFSFGQLVKVKINICKKLLNANVVDLWECIYDLFCAIIGNPTRAFHQNIVVLPCFHNHWIIVTNIDRGVVYP